MFGALSLLTNKWVWIGIIVAALSTGAVVVINKYNTAIETASTAQTAVKIANAETDRQKKVAKAAMDALNERIENEKKLNDKIEKYRREENVYKAKISKLSSRLANSNDAGAINDYNDSVRTELERIQGRQFSSEEIEAASSTSTNGSICLSPRLSESLLIDLKHIADNYEIVYGDDK